MKRIWQFWVDHGTKVLGNVSTLIAGFIAIPDLIAKEHVKWWAASLVVLGVMTVKRGFTNSNNGD
ncbi:MAG: hypothetical protein U1F35_05480 [Steroidobacteraceae bacterium]